MNMEKPTEGETMPDNRQEQELSFDQQLELAKVLFDAVDERNVFIKRQGGFDTFAEAGQYIEGMRDTYDKMEEDVSKARREFDEKVFDKKGFVNKLKEMGKNDLADTITSMFGVSKK
jgi:hypothetical protein